jgi:hypothetical protein
MTVMIAAALSLKLDLGTLIQRHKQPAVRPHVECNIKTVSYRFVGAAGTEFRYDGETFRVPAAGSIELLASKKATEYEIGGKTLPLDVWPADEFGARTVPLPAINQ